MDTLYDERVLREVPVTFEGEDGGYTGYDMYYLRVQLFKAEASVARSLLGVDRWPIYFLLEEYESFVGEPGDDRGPHTRTKKRTYTTGPDSKRIRQAVVLATDFGGKRAYNSK